MKAGSESFYIGDLYCMKYTIMYPDDNRRSSSPLLISSFEAAAVLYPYSSGANTYSIHSIHLEKTGKRPYNGFGLL